MVELFSNVGKLHHAMGLQLRTKKERAIKQKKPMSPEGVQQFLKAYVEKEDGYPGMEKKFRKELLEQQVFREDDLLEPLYEVNQQKSEGTQKEKTAIMLALLLSLLSPK